jgi:hypothetical protein
VTAMAQVFDSWYLGYRAPDRALATQIHERLLNSEYRTPDPNDADFFLVPFDARMVHPPSPRSTLSVQLLGEILPSR